jgi:hypothetical protein
VEKNDRGNVIQVALFESGDGQWQLEAIQNIADHLRSLLAETEAKSIPILA